MISQLKVKRWKDRKYADTRQKKMRLATLKSNKIHFRPKNITRDKEVHFIIVRIKGSNNQEKITVLNAL